MASLSSLKQSSQVPSINKNFSTTADYAITTTDQYDQVILTGTVSRQITLPAAASSTGRKIVFTNLGTSASVLTVTRAGSDTIGPGSETSITLSLTGDAITLVSDGTSNWKFVGSYYQSTAVSSTFTFNGSGGVTGSVVMIVIRNGAQVTVKLPFAIATTGTNSDRMVTNTALPSWARPSATINLAINYMRNNGGTVNAPGVAIIDSSGIFTIIRDASLTIFTNAASAGIAGPVGVCYNVIR